VTSSKFDDVEMIPILTFLLGEQYYALFIEEVIEVAAMVELVNVTDAPAGVLGLANRHGAVLLMVDLRTVMGSRRSPIDEWTLFVVASYSEQSIGLVVDEVQQVEYIPVAQVHESTASGKCIRGIISYRQRLIQLVALDALLAEYSSGAVTDDVLRIDS
jgi:chemotaxis signal transduction protein